MSVFNQCVWNYMKQLLHRNTISLLQTAAMCREKPALYFIIWQPPECVKRVCTAACWPEERQLMSPLPLLGAARDVLSEPGSAIRAVIHAGRAGGGSG